MKIIKIAKGNEKAIFSYINNRSEEDFEKIDEQVLEMIKNVKREGDQALFYYNEIFDGVKQQNLLISKEEIENAYVGVEEDFKQALSEAANNIKMFHEKQLEQTWIWEKSKEISLGQLITPMDSAGVYVPGGKAAYPSTVLMNVIPAKIAGVKRIVMVTPPNKEGKVNPYILAAAKVAGADEVFAVGGAQSIAALAYGTKSIAPVNKITGPGNIYVARAKKAVFGVVDIDMIAGPSEICILGDEKANPVYVAADMLSQAEHDEMAVSIYVTTSTDSAAAVSKELEKQLELLDRVKIAKEAIENNGLIFIADDKESMFEIANEIAPEHLEILLDDPKQYLKDVRNAGAIFLGEYSPEPLGDYLAGPNHTLPTSGTAKFASPLGVYDFIKKSSIISYSKSALLKDAGHIMKIAEKEGLTAHGNAIDVRRK